MVPDTKIWLVLALGAAVGCQPFQVAPIAGQGMLFQPPPVLVESQPPVPRGPAMASPAGNATIIQPQAQPGTGVVSANPIFIPVKNQDWAWEQIVDVVDDYFRIERESRVQLVGNIVTEGRIDTFPQIGATVLERHRPDSVGRYNRWESTFQTIRRRGLVRVIPEQGGYLIDLAVYKELEDLPYPENATAGAATFRYDDSLSSRFQEEVSHTRLSEHWVPLGRDTDCEQQILAEIRARLCGTNDSGVLLR
jgi:hypothetical protein